MIVGDRKQNGTGGKGKSREGSLDFWEKDDHDDDGASGDESVPNDIETLMNLVIPMMIITMME